MSQPDTVVADHPTLILACQGPKPIHAGAVHAPMKILLCLPLLVIAAWAQSIAVERLELQNVQAEPAQFEGKAALRVTPSGENMGLAVVKGTSFHNGVIEVDIAAKPGAGGGQGARGFVGISFRLQDGGKRREVIYLRPTNGRVNDQLRRNHSTQYVSEPEWPWERLRKEAPGVYESYVDLVPGVWTKYKIVVNGNRAELFVHEAQQPCLIVNDLKLGDATGPVALWIGPGTEAYFSNLRIAAK